MYIVNITFVIEPHKEESLRKYLIDELMPVLFNPESPAKSPELRKVVEIGGEKPDPEHGLSIALSASFDSLEVAHKWDKEILLPALGDFHLKFGPHGLYFETILEKIQ